MSRKKTTQKLSSKAANLSEAVHPKAAGIDVGAEEIYVAVQEDREGKPTRCFSSFTDDLHRMGDWLKECGVTTVAMESTGVYWIPLYQVLEEKGLEVCLVNAREVKNVPGRKSDVQDCQWLLTLHTHGLLRGSFHPPEKIGAMRSIHRQRTQFVENSATYIQHMQKALTQMNLQLHHVLSDITGVSGLAILDAILAGERDPKKLATLAHPRVRAKTETIERSLQGTWQSHHLFTLGQSLETYRFLLKMIEACDVKLHRQMEELGSQSQEPLAVEKKTGKQKWKQKSTPLGDSFHWEEQLYRIFGVNLLEVPGISVSTALVFLSEVGSNLSRFASDHHFGSWLRLAPQNKISGGKILSSQTPHRKNNLGLALRNAAQSLYHSKSELGEIFRRLKAKMGAPKAITAMAYRLARILYAMITKKQSYNPKLTTKNEAHRLLKKQQWFKKQLSDIEKTMSQYQQVAT